MTRTYYRLQDADPDPAELLDPDHQWSSDWSDITDPRRGVSVCATPYALGLYFSARAASCDYDADFLATLVMVEVEATLSDEDDLDAAEGALLVIPTSIVSATPLDDDMIAAICG